MSKQTSKERECDIVIIGSGIAGMTAAIYLKRANLDILVIEENSPGGQLNKITDIENYPGFLKKVGSELALDIYSQVSELGVNYLFDKVIKTKLDEPIKTITTVKETIKCNYVVVATGKISKKLNPNDDLYLGMGVSYCALCDGNLYKGKDVLVIGSANSAMEDALYLSSLCHKVTMIVRANMLQGDSILIDKINKQGNITVLYHTNCLKYNIENDKLVSCLLDNNQTIPCSGVFVSIGSSPSTSIFDVDKKNGFILVNEDYMTNCDSVYACGDAILKPVYQLTTAAGDATVAAKNIINRHKNSK